MKNELWIELNQLLSDETIKAEHEELAETVSLIVKQIELGKEIQEVQEKLAKLSEKKGK